MKDKVVKLLDGLRNDGWVVRPAAITNHLALNNVIKLGPHTLESIDKAISNIINKYHEEIFIVGFNLAVLIVEELIKNNMLKDKEDDSAE